MENIDVAWDNFINHTFSDDIDSFQQKTNDSQIPKCSKVYISTKTMIGYLNQSIPLIPTFWFIKTKPYHIQKECIIKKEIKINCKSEKEVDTLMERTEKIKDNVIIIKRPPTIQYEYL